MHSIGWHTLLGFGACSPASANAVSIACLPLVTDAAAGLLVAQVPLQLVEPIKIPAAMVVEPQCILIEVPLH